MLLISLLILAASPLIGSQTDERVKAVPKFSEIPLGPSPVLKAELRLTLNSNGTPATCKVLRVWHTEKEYHGEHPDYCVPFMKYHKDVNYELDDEESYATAFYSTSAPIH